MTREEALVVIDIVKEADGGCVSCLGDLLDDFIKRMPEQPWVELLAEVDPDNSLIEQYREKAKK